MILFDLNRFEIANKIVVKYNSLNSDRCVAPKYFKNNYILAAPPVAGVCYEELRPCC